VEEIESLDQKGVQVVLRLRAPGVDREVLDRAFEPLASVQSNISSSVGLSVAREVLEKRGAHIDFRSSNNSRVSDATICIFVPFA